MKKSNQPTNQRTSFVVEHSGAYQSQPHNVIDNGPVLKVNFEQAHQQRQNFLQIS